jgi:hypothetical protein
MERVGIRTRAKRREQAMKPVRHKEKVTEQERIIH